VILEWWRLIQQALAGGKRSPTDFNSLKAEIIEQYLNYVGRNQYAGWRF
jgi:hypothetical protein